MGVEVVVMVAVLEGAVGDAAAAAAERALVRDQGKGVGAWGGTKEDTMEEKAV